MQYDDFIGAVQNRGQLGSREAALGISRATLTTLSERVQSGEAENLAAQLPEELGRLRAVFDGDVYRVREVASSFGSLTRPWLHP
ncbi:hypothetical protein C481_08391 [Natrialba asiatica DSM 12278]|uniref:Uncharacterized protein n=1 Tax=Natrialba asiatica (strain ATCC 700177 / DSM 12278 / JCM 9576 / FERM P-10747 / NBRC 102637 / 172P1) TaxID=29540 RepID=M0AWG7_NATA1|nr:DUF2267 domain-containing protein [Natrialba asiatica]ELZ02672.1 hypothetical protein C481_08391 [Natrialba asiatica DSM 12278]